jgi:hypothetical protein
LVHSLGQGLISFEPKKEMRVIDIGLCLNKVKLCAARDLRQKTFH